MQWNEIIYTRGKSKIVCIIRIGARGFEMRTVDFFSFASLE